MKLNGIKMFLGFQRLFCQNPRCGFLFKEISFFENWITKKITKDTVDNGAPLIKKNRVTYYLCPRCKAKNIVVLQGEKVMLEKIVDVELSGIEILFPRNVLPGRRVNEYGG
jgi:hypothetical protein